MTSATSPSNRQAVRRAFSLVELLVVIGIIIVIAGIVLPMIIKAYGTAENTKNTADLAAIGIALTQYKSDHGDYPRVSVGNTGATVLCQALIAPLNSAIDFHNGPGFRLRAQGRVYGPYLQIEKFKVDMTTTPTAPKITDRDNKPILYFPANRGRDLTAQDGYIRRTTGSSESTSAIDYTDNSTEFGNTAKFCIMIGDINPNGRINPAEGEVATATGAYLLYMAGPDGAYGTSDAIAAAVAAPAVMTSANLSLNRRIAAACDDILFAAE